MELLRTPNTLAATVAKPLRKEAKLPKLGATMAAPAPPEGQRGTEVYAIIRNMKVGADVQAVRVFVNAPNATASTPDTDPHFVDQIGILQHSDHDEHHKAPPSALVDLTSTLRNLAKLGEIKDDTISVVLLPVLREGAAAAKGSVVPASIEIAEI
jgi:hypothetical protein